MNKGTKEQQNKGTNEQRNKGTKNQKVHPIGSGITRSPGLVFKASLRKFRICKHIGGPRYIGHGIIKGINRSQT